MRTTATPPTPKARKKTTLLEFILFSLFGVMLLVGGMAVYSQISPSYEKVPSTIAEGFRRDRINILVIGIGGDTHPGKGKELADALMLVSLKPSTRQAALISIPRDYYIHSSGYGAHRINAAHDIGNNSGYPGRGPGLVSAEVTQITGQPVDAFVRIDFAAFEKLIDSLGGVDIYVYRPFHDRLFKQTFHGGWQRMDGKRALAFARYRHIQGAEGTGYARELRQQQIASAVRNKLRNLSTGQILRLLSDLMAISRHTTTNLTSGEITQLYRTFKDMESAKIRHVSLAPLTEVYTVQKFTDDGWAVRPLDPSGNAIRQMMKSVFNDTRPIANPDQIQIVEGETPRPATIAGDDTMMDPTALESPSRRVAKTSR
jgi:LCP family protein required for cell wall assembly